MCERFLIHSKYETVTPPALRYTSGIITTPISLRIVSALKVTGPFAASAISLALMRGALV